MTRKADELCSSAFFMTTRQRRRARTFTTSAPYNLLVQVGTSSAFSYRMSASQRPSSIQAAAPATSSFVRPRSLPAVVLPHTREDRRASVLASLLVHVLIVMLLVTPFAVHHAMIEQPQGAGGPGPAGGGGGGHSGNGGAPMTERLQFMQVAPQPAPAAPVPTPTVQVPPPPTPVPPPQPVKIEAPPTPPFEPRIAVVSPATAPQVAPIPGVGGGTGHDGTNGSGPGSGGGIGSGVGTGRGAGVGPGTGGGNQANYPPQPIELFLPPLPPPQKVRGFHLVAEFDVDESGHVRGFDFTPTKDGDYNKKLQEVLRNVRFRPGTRPDGTPIRMKTQLDYDF